MAQPGGSPPRRELFGAPWKGEGPLPLIGVAPQLQPLQGMLLRRSTDIYPKELARDMPEFFNSLLGQRIQASSVVGSSFRWTRASLERNSERQRQRRLNHLTQASPSRSARGMLGLASRWVWGAHASPRATFRRPAGKPCSARRRTPHARTRMLPKTSSATPP